MGIEQILALIATGIGVGFASGLLGVGGCFIMVPVQYWVLVSIGIDPTIAIRTAFGTNLLVVLPTAAMGALAHSRKGAVVWRAAVVLGISGAVGAFGGGWIASHLPGEVLKVAFGAAVVLGALRMITAKPPRIEPNPVTNTSALVAWGLVMGVVSGIIGIGGGVLMVPVMVFFLRFGMHQAVGTSTALMIFTAAGGALAYLFNGLGVQGLAPYSTGYLNWLQWILLAGCSIPMARVGAWAAHKLPAAKLKWIFIAVMTYMGLKMMGVFSWLGLPI